MSIHQLNMYGMDMVEVSIERLKAFEPPEGYYLAFSGGKDSVTVKALADMAGVKYDAHYNVTSVDPPELVQFVKTFPDVNFDFPEGGKTMWNIIPKRAMPPTRIARYCCAELKEGGGAGRFVVTGVRKDESVRRAKTRGGIELGEKKSSRRELLDPDNPTPEMMYHCKTYYKKVLNPIVDWTTDEVWEFIKEYNVRYCCLYDEGWTRIGCIGCPMRIVKHRIAEFARYPKYKQNYIKAFQRMIDTYKETSGHGYRIKWESGEDVFDWWLNEDRSRDETTGTMQGLRGQKHGVLGSMREVQGIPGRAEGVPPEAVLGTGGERIRRQAVDEEEQPGPEGIREGGRT